MTCAHELDVAAYVLSALEDDEAVAFTAHLPGCEDCRREVGRLQRGADALALAARQLEPPPELRDRIMRDVKADAGLLAPRESAPAPRRRRWRLGGRPLAGLAAAAAAVVVTAVIASDDGPSTRTLAAEATPPGARASLQLTGSRATLRLTGMPTPPRGRVYQVWLVRGSGAPQPTRTLFSVPRDGRASVAIGESVDGVREILVSTEPAGGSRAPTTRPLIRAVAT